MTSRSAETATRRRPPMIAGLAVLFVSVMLTLGAASLVRAGDTPQDPDANGGLRLQTRNGATRQAVRLGTDMQVTVTGASARVKVTQVFRNTGSDWVEATYLYPLPEEGSVDSLKMVVGQRIIIGEIARREAARQIYEAAKAQGQRAGLVEQERPNMFTNRVANIGPGETVLIEIEYQAPVRQVAGEYALRLPLVVGPRYVPGGVGAGAVTAPVAASRAGDPVNPVSISVRLAPGFTPADIVSPWHPVRIEADGAQARTVTLANGAVASDRDFELRWRSAETAPTVALFRERMGRQDYLMAMIAPPAPQARRATPPRELIFVIDNSGSMSGESMDQAKQSLKLALRTLTPADRFNVIRFDDSLTELFEQPVAASPSQVALAQRFADGLEAQGGTEMLPALRAALVDDTPRDTQRVRQVIFLTDGSISNEAEMLAALGEDRGRSRVFMVGIGSAPNTFLMSRMAEVGRGTFTHIGDTTEVTARMTDLLQRLTRPVVTDLRVSSTGGDAEFTPADLPDLYEGEPLVVLARTRRLRGQLVVEGVLDGRPWSRTLALSSARPGQGVARLWARRRVTDLEVATYLDGMEWDAASAAIAQLGLDFSIVTRETSLVAVDRTPARPEGARLTEEELPLALPHGWSFDGLFGAGAAAAEAAAQPEDPVELLPLPQTAANWARSMWIGLWLMLFGAGGAWLAQRRSNRRRAT